MRLLILGGSWFLGRALVDDGLARGWEVTCLTRGRSGRPPEGAEHVVGDRHSAADLARLAAAGPWDALVDTSAYEPSDVLEVLSVLGERAGRYVLMSTVSAYRDWPDLPVDETSPLWPSRVDVRETDPDVAAMEERFQYGVLKSGTELAAGTAPGGTLILRPGVILGPGEYTGRMLRYFERAQRGGRWLLGAPAEQKIQPIDVRDVARFTLDRIAAGDVGTFNTTAPYGHATYQELIQSVLDVTGGTAEPVWAAPDWLAAKGVTEWTEIPLWRRAPGTWQVSSAKAASAGLMCRSLRETVADTWHAFRVQPPIPHSRQAEHGMDPEREARLLAQWGDLTAAAGRSE